jgi:hypothetical protein
MKKILAILFPSIISALTLNVLIFNVITNADTRFDNQGIYFLSVFMLSFAISTAFNILMYIITNLQKEINTLKTLLDKKEAVAENDM